LWTDVAFAVARLFVLGALLMGCTTNASLPSASAGSTASPPSSPKQFTSSRYHYSLTLPAGWSTSAATATWDGTGMPGPEDGIADWFFGGGTMSSWAQAAPTSSDLQTYVAQRLAGNLQTHGDTCPSAATPVAREPISIGGSPAVFLAFDCGPLINIAVTVQNGIGYAFTFKDDGIHSATNSQDRAVFQTILDSVVFAK
jgi:hypothetical protein